MKGRIERIKEIIINGASVASEIRAVQLMHQEDMDIYDPYFVLSFDLYYRGDLPSDRRDLFPGAELYETSYQKDKDRILIDNLPLRVEYKDLETIDQQVQLLQDQGDYSPGEMSILINRVILGEVLMDPEGWLEGKRKLLNNPENSFWERLKEHYSLKMEHYLSDLKAAAFNGDPLFFHLSLGHFLHHCGALLLAINQKTEPSSRDLNQQLESLKKLPDGFHANYQTLLRSERELTLERKSEVAALFARSILGLLPSY